MQNNTAAPIGDNLPPSDAQLLMSRLNEQHQEQMRTVARLCIAAEQMPKVIPDGDETAAGAASDLIKLINAAKKVVEVARVAEKEPFLAQGRAVDGFFKVGADKLEAAIRITKGPLDTFLRRKEATERARRDEEARRLREQQETERAAALLMQQAKVAPAAAQLVEQSAITGQMANRAEKRADAPISELSQSRSIQGSLAQLRTVWVGEVTDQASLDLEKLRHHIRPEDLQKAINSYVKAGGRELAGAKIYEKSETVVR